MKPTVAALVLALVATVATANSHRRLRGGGDNISEDGEFWSRQLQGSGRRMEEPPLSPLHPWVFPGPFRASPSPLWVLLIGGYPDVPPPLGISEYGRISSNTGRKQNMFLSDLFSQVFRKRPRKSTCLNIYIYTCIYIYMYIYIYICI